MTDWNWLAGLISKIYIESGKVTYMDEVSKTSENSLFFRMHGREVWCIDPTYDSWSSNKKDSFTELYKLQYIE